MEPKKPNRHERRATLAIARRNRNARTPKENPGPCGVRRYSLARLRPMSVITVDLARATSDVISWQIVIVDKRRMGPDRVDGTVQIDARARVMRQAQRVTR